MKALTSLLFAALVLSAPMAHAQSTVKDLVFSEIEKRVIGEHFGVKASDMIQDAGAPEWAVKPDDGDEQDDAEDSAEDDEDRGKGKKDKGNKGNKGKGKKDKANGKSKGLPPGLAKRDELPPGLQRQLDKNGTLPAGLAKRDLPADLAAKLPARPANQEVTVIDNDVVLVDTATGIILDVLKDVVINGGTTTTAPSPGPDGSMAPPPAQEEPSALKSILDTIFGN